jgi:hypothetical protein
MLSDSVVAALFQIKNGQVWFTMKSVGIGDCRSAEN